MLISVSQPSGPVMIVINVLISPMTMRHKASHVPMLQLLCMGILTVLSYSLVGYSNPQVTGRDTGMSW